MSLGQYVVATCAISAGIGLFVESLWALCYLAPELFAGGCR